MSYELYENPDRFASKATILELPLRENICANREKIFRTYKCCMKDTEVVISWRLRQLSLPDRYLE